MPPQAYGARCCDGFQDVLVAGLAMYLDWGLHDTARGIFDNYYTHHLRHRISIRAGIPNWLRFTYVFENRSD